MTDRPKLRNCPKCGHPGGLIHCPTCHGPRKPDEMGNLALLTGTILGALMALPEKQWGVHTSVSAVFNDDGDYVTAIAVKRPSGTYLLTITKEEPYVG